MAYYNGFQPNWVAPQGYSSYPNVPQQSYQMPQQNMLGIQWVDGEVGAKAYQMPQGIPAGTPIALWDTNDQIIYLKSVNQMGMPNPLQKIHYTMDENQMKYLPAGQSGSPEPNYVTKEDLDIFKNELREMLKNNQMQRNNGQQNRGGNS